MNHRLNRRTLLAGAGAAVTAGGLGWVGEAAEEDINIGFLSALTGLDTILGETQKNCAELAVEEINAAGGIDGRQLAMIVEDTATDPKIAVEKASKLIKEDNVDVIIGLIRSSERNAVVSVTSKAKKLVVYTTFYEGGHCDPYLIVTSQVPNQSVDPFVPWIMENIGTRFFIAGSDYVWPRETAKAVRAAVEGAGGQVLGEDYFPFGTTDYSSLFARLGETKPEVIWPMMAGADAVAFYKQYQSFGFDIQVCTNALDELFAASAPEVAGAISNQSYFMTLDTPTNRQFITAYQARFGADARVDAIGEATYDAVHLYAKAVEEAGTTEVDPVVEAMGRIEFDAPQGTVQISPENHHMIANSIIGRANEQGLFDIIENFGQIPPKVEGCNLTDQA